MNPHQFIAAAFGPGCTRCGRPAQHPAHLNVATVPQTGEVVTLDGTFRVRWCGRLCSPDWQERGPAEVYLRMLERGQRRPEFVG